MLLISTTYRPATDLGYLLHKNPARTHALDLSFGQAWVAYPEASEDRTTAALIVDLDPVRLVRGSEQARGTLAQYVNDRPYVASSFVSVALVEAFGTAMAGRSKERPELAETPIPLEIEIPVLPCRSHPDRIGRLFGPLGYTVEVEPLPLDPEFPEWGESGLYHVTLRGTVTLRDALRQIYLLLPVLDAKKHYYLDNAEVAKIIQKGEGWLSSHPEKDWILRSSLGRRPSLVRDALEQLANVEEDLLLESEATDDALAGPELEEQAPDAGPAKPVVSLHQKRHERVVEVIRDLKPNSVIDVGCGEGRLMRMLIPIQGLQRIVGMDVSTMALERASKTLFLDKATPRYAERVQLIHGSLLYRDDRLRGFDVCAAVEVIEHLDLPRLDAFERVIFGDAQPGVVIVTTPNREYNAVYEIEAMRHDDHRFEWSRAEFAEWVQKIGEKFGYSAEIEGLGEAHEIYGAPSQMAVFKR